MRKHKKMMNDLILLQWGLVCELPEENAHCGQ